MCGLAGMARHPQTGAPLGTIVPIFETLVRNNEPRGPHATGFAAQDQTGEVAIWKQAVTARQAVASNGWNEAIAALTPTTQTLIGHTRYATLANGANDAAAHPFREGAIVGAHNGIIRNWQTLRGPDDTWIVDSQAAFALLDRAKDPNEALKQLEGYFVLTWLKKKSLYVVRSDGTQFAMAYVRDWRTMFWSSEETVLREALTAHHAPSFDLWIPKPATMYRYVPTEFGATKTAGRTTPLTLKTTKAKGSGARPSWADFDKPTHPVRERAADGDQSSLWRSRPDLVGGSLPRASTTLYDALGRPIAPPPTTRALAERIAALEATVARLATAHDLTVGKIEGLQTENGFLWSVVRDSGLLDGDPVTA